MNPSRKYLTILIGVAVLAAAGCRDNDVPPANNSGAVLDDRNAAAANGESAKEQPESERATVAGPPPVSEDDIVPDQYTREGATEPARMALATVQATEGNTAGGMVAFILGDVSDDHVRVVGKLTGLAPGAHGVHIHETGNCTAPDASSAGDHFNPAGSMHGDREAAVRHVGDLGNVVANADGIAEFDFEDRQLAFTGMNSIVGKAFIVHMAGDDVFTQPSGSSGNRVGCGVISSKPAVLVPQ
jgi:Cu-Zn family superoxide dismutase